MLEDEIVVAAINGELLEDLLLKDNNITESKLNEENQRNIELVINGDSESFKPHEMKNTELIKTLVSDEPARS